MTRRLVGIYDICANLARWVCQQHPYHLTVHVDSANARLMKLAPTKGFEPESLPMKYVKDSGEIEEFLREALDKTPEVLDWNSRKNGNESPLGFSSRYDTPVPENDFIDIDALFRNVARSTWYEAEEYPELKEGE